MIFSLDDRLLFPDTSLAEPDGLLAVGGDLSAQRLLLAYRSGIFPWYSDETPILWYAPPKRCVLFPNELIISKSTRKILNSNTFKVTVDQCFADVIHCCAEMKREGQDGTWITHDMQNAYIELHHQGYAHSVEVWQGDTLVGGLYGVAVGNTFCGESMFSKVSNASKIAMIALCKDPTYAMIDCQLHTDHLASMGAGMISRDDYLALLSKGLM